MLPRETPDSVFEAPVTGHSRKPDVAYEMIEAMYSGPYVELFARRPREGWVAWGDEVDHGRSTILAEEAVVADRDG
jgi:N6-adenosine-specific RNA methylase IME4